MAGFVVRVVGEGGGGRFSGVGLVIANFGKF